MFGDVGGMIADPLEVLGDEQQMGRAAMCADFPSCESTARGTWCCRNRRPHGRAPHRSSPCRRRVDKGVEHVVTCSAAPARHLRQSDSGWIGGSFPGDERLAMFLHSRRCARPRRRSSAPRRPRAGRRPSARAARSAARPLRDPVSARRAWRRLDDRPRHRHRAAAAHRSPMAVPRPARPSR